MTGRRTFASDQDRENYELDQIDSLDERVGDLEGGGPGGLPDPYVTGRYYALTRAATDQLLAWPTGSGQLLAMPWLLLVEHPFAELGLYVAAEGQGVWTLRFGVWDQDYELVADLGSSPTITAPGWVSRPLPDPLGPGLYIFGAALQTGFGTVPSVSAAQNGHSEFYPLTGPPTPSPRGYLKQTGVSGALPDPLAPDHAQAAGAVPLFALLA